MSLPSEALPQLQDAPRRSIRVALKRLANDEYPTHSSNTPGSPATNSNRHAPSAKRRRSANGNVSTTAVTTSTPSHIQTPPPSTSPNLPPAVNVPRRRMTHKSDLWIGPLLNEFRVHAAQYLPLIASVLPEDTATLTTRLTTFFQENAGTLTPPSQPLNFALQQLHQQKDSMPPDFASVLQLRRFNKEARRRNRRVMGVHVFIYKQPHRLDGFRFTTALFYLSRLSDKCEYPPRGEWVAEQPAQHSSWSVYIKNSPLPDNRNPRRPVHLLDKSRLQLEIPSDLSCLVYDKETGDLVCSVVRNLSGLPGMFVFAKKIISQGVAERKSIRLEDAGSLVMIGNSAGSRSKPTFAPAKNLLCKSTDTTEFNRQTSALCAYAWLRMKAFHPDEVIGDFECFYREHDIPRLNPDWPASAEERGPITLPLDCGGFTFAGADFAPGCAVLAQRYARAVHREVQPHRWALSWTTLRAGSDLRGGNFVLSPYGLFIHASQDSSIAWKPEDWHTTTLGTFEPTFDVAVYDDPVFNQQGISFVTSSRIKTVFLKWKNTVGYSGKQKVEEIVRELEEATDDTGEYYE